MKKIILFLIFIISTTTKVYAQEPVLQLMQGQTVIEDMCSPTNKEIEEAEKYLSENHIDVPEEIEELCVYYGKKNNILPELLEAIIWKESRFKADAIDVTGTCKGLMQIKPYTHLVRMKKCGVTNIFDPAGNIAVGSDYLKELLEEYELETAIMLYNGDKRALEKNYISDYTEKILEVSQALESRNFKYCHGCGVKMEREDKE